MWLLISSESEHSRFGEFGGDFGEGGARVFPWEKNSVQKTVTRYTFPNQALMFLTFYIKAATTLVCVAFFSQEKTISRGLKLW